VHLDSTRYGYSSKYESVWVEHSPLSFLFFPSWYYSGASPFLNRLSRPFRTSVMPVTDHPAECRYAGIADRFSFCMFFITNRPRSMQCRKLLSIHLPYLSILINRHCRGRYTARHNMLLFRARLLITDKGVPSLLYIWSLYSTRSSTVLRSSNHCMKLNALDTCSSNRLNAIEILEAPEGSE
jgi:hypothetical protein